ncbi:YggS family pyridoxal phosphate-dependent enzyme [Marinicrinis lubricantis]|uniref:Pyridoxal phosphate homeostasis protein n=1 Tax=Marinicrinis lubricantis TaxID=2086470 RepID=A0ABW1ISA3_9BACL
MTKEEQLKERWKQVEARIGAACLRSGRRPEDIHLIAVTKYVSAKMTELVLDQGLEHIGENRWQDAKEKWNQLHHRGIWHFIGHLQSNKAKDVVGKFDYIHSLDRFSLAEAIGKKAEQEGLRVKCFLQVNVSGEESKYGLEPDKLFDFAKQVRTIPNIEVVGLMTMAPFSEDAEEARPVFRGLRELRDELNRQAVFDTEIRHLSMGMSNDFEIAIEEGATWLRLGSILVGKDEGGESTWES